MAEPVQDQEGDWLLHNQGRGQSCQTRNHGCLEEHLLPKLLDDIYNAGETSLFHKLQLNKSLVLKDKDVRGGKCSKFRITVMHVGNMSAGTHELKPPVINNCWKPHVFSQWQINVQQLPVEFHTNKKAWMTSSLFNASLYKQNRIFTRPKRKVTGKDG